VTGGVAAGSGHPTVAVGAVARRGDELLLVRRGRGPAQGEWSVPGGHVELGETLHEAVVRETAEETGLEVVVDRFLGWVERMDQTVGERGAPPVFTHFVILDFAVTLLDPDATPTPGDDALEARWVPVDELSELRLVAGLHEFLVDHGVLER
jgi:ADP-ribose pyrophosphatase YjhB (NUDIX family)